MHAFPHSYHLLSHGGHHSTNARGANVTDHVFRELPARTQLYTATSFRQCYNHASKRKMCRAASSLRTPCCAQHRFHAALLAAPSCKCGAAPLGNVILRPQARAGKGQGAASCPKEYTNTPIE